MENKKQISFYYIDPYNHLNYDKKLGDENKCNARVMENEIMAMLNEFSGKKVWFKILDDNHYTWQLGSPFDDIIIAYSYKEDFSLDEAQIIFDNEQEELED